jgi:hypothetical protein
MPESLDFGESVEVPVAAQFSQGFVGNVYRNDLQIAIRTSLGTVFGEARIPLEFLTVPAGKIDEGAFREKFAVYQCQVELTLDAVGVADERRLAERNVFVVAKRGNKTAVAFAFPESDVFVAELTQNLQSVGIIVKGRTLDFLAVIEANAEWLFTQK